MKTQKSTKNYYDFRTEDNSFESVLRAAKKEGYNYMFNWVNSERNWYFFQTTENKARKAAIELYMNEKNETDIKFAERFFSEHIDINEVNYLLKNL